LTLEVCSTGTVVGFTMGITLAAVGLTKKIKRKNALRIGRILNLDLIRSKNFPGKESLALIKS